MFNSSTFIDYKNQKSWGRITGTICYIIAISVVAFGLGMFFVASKKEQFPVLLGYCEIISAQFLGAGAILYGASKATESFVTSRSPNVGASVASEIDNSKTAEAVSNVTAKVVTLLESKKDASINDNKEEPAPRINLDD